MKAKVNKTTIEIIDRTLHTMKVDCIATITDPNLTLDSALLQHTGTTVLDQVQRIAWADIGEAVITDTGKLDQIKKLIHIVAPRWGEDSARGKLALATWNALQIAEDNELRSIALPPISVGSLGFPLEATAKIMLEEIIDFTFEKPKHLKKIYLCANGLPLATEIFIAEFQRQLEVLRENNEGTVSV